MSERHAERDVFECVEPEVGRQLWRWTGPEATPEQRTRREDHLRICDACRLEAAVERGVAAGLADGSLALAGGGAHPPRRRPSPSRRRLFPTLMAAAAGMAAAGLALTAALPPVAPPQPGRDRAGAPAGFVRPVEGETVPSAGPSFRWRPVAGATSYELRIAEVDGGFAWTGTSSEPRLDLPATVTLPAGGAYRAYVTPVPRDLAPAGALGVRFTSGGTAAVLRFRALAAAWPARLLLAGGALLALGALVLRVRDGARARRAPA